MKILRGALLLSFMAIVPLAACGEDVLGGGGGSAPNEQMPSSSASGPAVSAVGGSTSASAAQSSTGVGSTGTTATVAASSSGGPPPTGPTQEFAILYQDLPPWPSDLGGNLGMPQADTLVLVWGTRAESCESPFVDTMPTSASDMEGLMLIPSDLVKVGPVDLSSNRVMWIDYNYFAGGGGGGGGGPYPVAPSGEPSTLEIVSIDATSITVNIVTPLSLFGGGTMNGMPLPQVNLQGMYKLPRC